MTFVLGAVAALAFVQIVIIILRLVFGPDIKSGSGQGFVVAVFVCSIVVVAAALVVWLG
jgi:hypothetical protein